MRRRLPATDGQQLPLKVLVQVAKRAVGGGVKVSYISQQNNSHVLEVPEVGGQRRWRLPASYLHAVAALPHCICFWQAVLD